MAPARRYGITGKETANPGRAAAMTRQIFREGKRLCIIRPADPLLAIASAMSALKSQSKEDFEKVLHEQRYTYRGYAWERRERSKTVVFVASIRGEFLEAIRPGDSFIPEGDFVREGPLS